MNPSSQQMVEDQARLAGHEQINAAMRAAMHGPVEPDALSDEHPAVVALRNLEDLRASGADASAIGRAQATLDGHMQAVRTRAAARVADPSQVPSSDPTFDSTARQPVGGPSMDSLIRRAAGR